MKQFGKDINYMTRGSLGLSIGSDVVTKAGGDAKSLATMSRYMPSMGVISGGGVMLRTIGKMMPKKYRKRRY